MAEEHESRQGLESRKSDELAWMDERQRFGSELSLLQTDHTTGGVSGVLV